MTREEAKTILVGKINPCLNGTDWKDAVDMAIEALEQEPYNTSEWCHDCSEYNHEKHCCPRYNKVIRNAVEEMKQESCEDCISKAPVKKAIDEMLEWIESDNRHNCDYFIVDKIEEIIKELSIDTLPSVQPKVKTGHWIKMSVGYGCSECTLATNDYGKNMYRYCPNCGAKMESEVEDEDDD